MNQKVIYNFAIKAISPIHFGAGQDGQERKLMKDTQGKPVLPGNSIGGALREYLKEAQVPEKIILKYMGGVQQVEAGQETFITSGIYISDGKIAEDAAECFRKEGTAVNPAYGAAENHMKYTLDYLPEGTEISFRIEGDVWDGKAQDNIRKKEGLCAAELEKLISTWAYGFDTQTLVLGGQKSNGFGKFEIKKLVKTVFSFDSGQAVDEYLFRRKSKKGDEVVWKDLAHYSPANQNTVVFSMSGAFPYGVYQAFTSQGDSDTAAGASVEFQGGQQRTGLLKKANGYFIPSTSLKGLIKNEVRMLLKRMKCSEKLADQKLDCLFGGKERRGKLVFSDLQIEAGSPVEVDRYIKREGKWNAKKGQPIYNKIDRLTAGGFDSALIHRQEIQGTAEIRFELLREQVNFYENPCIFPLVYVLRRIGMGAVPLGGRTVTGLGQFSAQTVTIAVNNNTCEIETDQGLSGESSRRLEQWFESFKRWCDDENTSEL